MNRDDLVWEALDNSTVLWDQQVRTKEVYRAVSQLILRYKNGEPELMHLAVKGGFNTIYRLEFKDGSSVVMRVPIQGMLALYELSVTPSVLISYQRKLWFSFPRRKFSKRSLEARATL